MSINIGALITSFSIALLILPMIIKYALRKQWLDEPGRRKVHKRGTPTLGGIAIFVGFFLSSIIWIETTHWKDIRFVLVPCIVIFITGLRDDLVPLKPLYKLFGQLVAACFLVLIFDVRLHSFYSVWSVEWPLWVSYLMTIFTIIVVTNSFNLIDGLDGLAGSLSSTSLLCLGFWFYMTGDEVFSIFCFSMVGAILSFLCFNWEPSEIFMGDTGALTIGFFLSIAVIRFINADYNLPESDDHKIMAEIGAGVCFISIPLLDTLRIILLRLSKGQSPFRPDKSHIHHAVIRLGLSHAKTCLLLVAVQALFIVLAYSLRRVGDIILLPIIIAISIILGAVLDRLIKNKVKEVGIKSIGEST